MYLSLECGADGRLSWRCGESGLHSSGQETQGPVQGSLLPKEKVKKHLESGILSKKNPGSDRRGLERFSGFWEGFFCLPKINRKSIIYY